MNFYPGSSQQKKHVPDWLYIVLGAVPLNSARYGTGPASISSYLPSLLTLPSPSPRESNLLSHAIPRLVYKCPSNPHLVFKSLQLGLWKERSRNGSEPKRPGGKDPEWASPSFNRGMLYIKGSTLHFVL